MTQNAAAKAEKKKKQQGTPVVDQQKIQSDTEEKSNGSEQNAAAKAENGEPPLEVGVASVAVISSSATPVEKDPNTVTIRVKYPENYKGKKYLAEGQEYTVSPESAEALITQGIAEKVDQ